MRTARYLTQKEISKIRRLSKDHYIKDIARIMGVTKVTIRNVQDDPRNKIVNPLRKYTVTGKYKKQAGKVVEGYFNWEEYKKYYAY
jgi:hypothetical protein